MIEKLAIWQREVYLHFMGYEVLRDGESDR